MAGQGAGSRPLIVCVPVPRCCDFAPSALPVLVVGRSSDTAPFGSLPGFRMAAPVLVVPWMGRRAAPLVHIKLVALCLIFIVPWRVP